MLYLIATPIGNLDDLTFRALKTLQEVDYLLCEDTRHTQRLLARYDLKKPLRSYHKFNEAKRCAEVIEDLKQGQKIALVSDAGTPTLFDPGSRLVRACREAALPFTALPGPASPILALVLSGFDLSRFQCIGFLPKKSGALKSLLLELLAYPGTSSVLESPYRLLKTLQQIAELAPERKLFVARELTKKFEEGVHGTATELLNHWKDRSPKGEIILVISEEI